MNTNDQIFLTAGEAVQSVCEDFKQYDPQILLFSEIIAVVSHGRLIAKRDAGKEGLWIHLPDELRMRWLEGEALIDFMCDLVSKTPLNPDELAAVCRRVFRTEARAGRHPETDRPGVRLSTGMREFECQQCGRCCRTLVYFDALAPEDVDAWKRAGREDILKWVGVFPKKNGATVYRVWIKPGTREFVAGCPFLHKNPHENRWVCRIQDVKPRFCRQYPLSRKHALMTGCPGFKTK